MNDKGRGSGNELATERQHGARLFTDKGTQDLVYAEVLEGKKVFDACAQVLDDSTDKGTRDLVDDKVLEWKERGVDVEVRRRTNRQGYKAGALHEVGCLSCLTPIFTEDTCSSSSHFVFRPLSTFDPAGDSHQVVFALVHKASTRYRFCTAAYSS